MKNFASFCHCFFFFPFLNNMSSQKEVSLHILQGFCAHVHFMSNKNKFIVGSRKINLVLKTVIFLSRILSWYNLFIARMSCLKGNCTLK